MKLYDCEPAPNPRRARVFIAEKGLDIETVQIDLGSGEQFSDDFRKINPDCVVPVLQLDDGTYLTEVLAICQYLEDLHPEPALMGSNAEERARILMWHCKAEQQGLSAVGDAFRNTAKGMKDRALTGPVNYEQIPALAERGRARIEQFYDRIDAQLADSEFLAGDRYSLADITAMTAVDFGGWVKVSVPETATNLQRWYAAVSSRPSAAA